MTDTIAEIYFYIDSQLSQNTYNSINVVTAIATDCEISNICKFSPEFAYLLLALNIYTLEIEKLPFTETIFQNIRSLKDIKKTLTTYKHLIFNIDFNVERSAAITCFKELLHNHKISYIALQYLIEHMSFNKAITSKLIINQENL